MTSGRLITTIIASLVVAACAAAQPMPTARAFTTLRANVPQVATANDARELRIRWTVPRVEAAGTRTRSTGSFTLLAQSRIVGAPRRERQPQPSANDLVVVVQDSSGRDVDWRIVPNPRLLRLETPGPDGTLSGRVIEREDAELLVYIPDVAGVDRIQIFSPVWNGKEYTLEPLGQLDIGRVR